MASGQNSKIPEQKILMPGVDINLFRPAGSRTIRAPAARPCRQVQLGDDQISYRFETDFVACITEKSGLELRRKRAGKGSGLSQVSNLNRLCRVSLQAPQFLVLNDWRPEACNVSIMTDQRPT